MKGFKKMEYQQILKGMTLRAMHTFTKLKSAELKLILFKFENTSWHAKKKDLKFYRFVVLQRRMHSPCLDYRHALFCLKLPQGPFYMPANRNGSGKTAVMYRLVWACASYLCDKYPFLMCWLLLLDIHKNLN